MLDLTIKRLLDQFPRGASDGQLIWRLRDAGLRVPAEELLHGLTNLADRGEITRDSSGRWNVVRPKILATGFPVIPGTLGPNSSVVGAKLYAVPATCHEESADAWIDFESAGLEESTPNALPAWPSLLEYYAATQRQDPRGRIVEFVDRHSTGWQLIRMGQRWWSDARLTVAMEALPETFREALMRRRIQSAAIGWPMTFFEMAEGVAAIPSLILPAEWQIEGPDLVLRPSGGRPTINPSWLWEVRSRTPWTEVDLIERLFPEGEPDDLGAASERMRHALATQGGGSLKPADLMGEVTIVPDRLQNAAALFLPEDGTFTKGAAEDLETLKDWPAQAQHGTALEALFAAEATNSATTDVPVLSIKPLTDRQMEAAEAALRGPLTVIQGPPGTGKSHVILSLVLSAVMSGRSVLFASKNHQALDEVENRLREIVSEAPLLTRGRDAEGQQDTNALKVLREIAHGVARGNDPGLDAERTKLLRCGAMQSKLRETKRSRLRLDLELSELVERYASIQHHLPGSRSVSGRCSLVVRLKAIVARLLGRTPAHPLEPLPDVSLIPRDRNVPANREFVSEPMTGFEWGIDKKKIEFYVLKGDREVRSWIAEKGDGPKKNVPVTLQLRQMPGQSWARLSISSSEWGPLARDPIRLDWDALEPDDRSPEQILEKLKRPRPVIPNRVDEHPHIGLWNGELVQPGLAAVLDHGADQVYRALSRSWRDNRWVEQRQTYRPVGTDGTLPEELSLSDKEHFDDILKLLEKKIWQLVNRNDFAIGNRELLCLTWSFTRCPESIKNLIIDFLNSYNSNRRHILHSIPSAKTVLQQGAGRAIDGPERVARLLHILSELNSPNTHTRAALSFLLSRRKEAPEALTEKLVQKIAKQLCIRLINLHENNSFKQDFKYVLMILTGLLRYREISPFSLIANENNTAEKIQDILLKIEKTIRRHVNSITQGRDKLAIVGELLKMLAGTGGDPDLLRRIDDLND